MPREKLSPEVLALIHLRSAAGLSAKDLASRLGLDPRPLYRYEGGEKRLRREDLDALAAGLGYPAEAVDALLFVQDLIAPGPREAASPVALTPAELRRIDRAAINAGWTAAAGVRASLRRRKKREKAAAAREKAEELWKRLKTVHPALWRDLVALLPELRSWALAEKVSHESVRAAADKPDVALELAELALLISERLPGEEDWRSRMKGYCLAHVANARRVANDHAGADEAFARAWALWRAGAETELLHEWRLLDLEASLRRAERRFPEALELLERAMAKAQADQAAVGRILLNREFILEQMGDIQGVLATLAEAAPYVEASGDPRQLFALRFKTANNLWHLERHTEAAELLPEIREMAVRLGNELDLLRLLWLEARILAAQGLKEEAAVRLEQVRQDFTARQLPYDAALSSLDLAVLWLEAGRTADVRKAALAMAWIFKARGIAREALAALSLFLDAAQREAATVELARRVMAEIEEARRGWRATSGSGR
ncbi:MAG TPA: helix-turn-helix transcriptional regulator [Thermoanaerobaculia bacterium]|nr:helix-turn-helix transcriptional regulator [Thermoanaerobaculia bacterium]